MLDHVDAEYSRLPGHEYAEPNGRFETLAGDEVFLIGEILAVNCSLRLDGGPFRDRERKARQVAQELMSIKTPNVDISTRDAL
jgi:hypothetical protein